MHVIGQVYETSDVIQVGDNGFAKRELILKTVEEYAQYIKIEFHKEKGALLDSFNQGDNIKVHYNLRGRKWEKEDGEVEFYNSIVGWRIEKI